MGVVHTTEIVSHGDVIGDHVGVSFQQIAETILTGTASDIIFSSIPDTYRSLYITVFGRSDVGATSEFLRLQFNGDTGAHYDDQTLTGSATTPSALSASAVVSMRVGRVTGGTGVAGVSSFTTIWVPDYARTAWQKCTLSSCSQKGSAGAGGMTVDLIAGMWRDASVINQVRLFPNGGIFQIDTVATIWGWTG